MITFSGGKKLGFPWHGHRYYDSASAAFRCVSTTGVDITGKLLSTPVVGTVGGKVRGGQVFKFKKPGVPAVSTTEGEQAVGMLWCNYAVLSGFGCHLYGVRLRGTAENDGWTGLYLDDAAVVWGIKTAPALWPAEKKITCSFWFRQFGVFGQKWSQTWKKSISCEIVLTKFTSTWLGSDSAWIEVDDVSEDGRSFLITAWTVVTGSQRGLPWLKDLRKVLSVVRIDVSGIPGSAVATAIEITGETDSHGNTDHEDKSWKHLSYNYHSATKTYELSETTGNLPPTPISALDYQFSIITSGTYSTADRKIVGARFSEAGEVQVISSSDEYHVTYSGALNDAGVRYFDGDGTPYPIVAVESKAMVTRSVSLFVNDAKIADSGPVYTGQTTLAGTAGTAPFGWPTSVEISSTSVLPDGSVINTSEPDGSSSFGWKRSFDLVAPTPTVDLGAWFGSCFPWKYSNTVYGLVSESMPSDIKYIHWRLCGRYSNASADQILYTVSDPAESAMMRYASESPHGDNRILADFNNICFF